MKDSKLQSLSSEDTFDLIGKQWMLVTAGTKDSFNTMTASWGGLGWLWNKPVAFVFIRPERYTHDFIESSDRMTLSFFSEAYRKALQFCGTRSGRKVNKIEATGLTPCVLPSGTMGFDEARLTLDCRKLFKTSMHKCNFIDQRILELWYNNNPGGSLHDVYIVEIENIFEKSN